MPKNYKFASILGALGVILGAFGSHWLKTKVDPSMVDTYKTGVLYHFIHVFAIYISLILGDLHKLKNAVFTARLFAYGIILFSGSLYIMAIAKALGSYAGFLGPVTPLGGLAFLAGWISLFFNLGKKDKLA